MSGHSMKAAYSRNYHDDPAQDPSHPAELEFSPTSSLAFSARDWLCSLPCISQAIALQSEESDCETEFTEKTGKQCPSSAGYSTLANSARSRVIDLSSVPTWESDIKDLFVAPFWLPEATRRKTGAGWIGAMKHFGAIMPDGQPLTLDKYEHVKLQAKTIYDHVASRSMPITSNEAEYFPDKALTLISAWMDHGCPKARTEVTGQISVPTKVVPKSFPCRVRKDVRDLTAQEVQILRAKLQDVLHIDKISSKWQELGELHSWWCLHYQEATFFWHRAWLKYVEELIDFPIPYWNMFAADAADPMSPYSGIPQIFLDETYTHPDGTIRLNPLKYALAYQGRSKNGESKWVQRDPVLQAGRPTPNSPAFKKWKEKIAWLNLYSTQLVNAMGTSRFSMPQGIGIPWENIPTFSQNVDSKYYVSQHSFDGWFEQIHDNGHGWVGGPKGDMSDNVYTAFDPMFLVYHCNLDRKFDEYLMNHPNTPLSSSFPLQPFINSATQVDYASPEKWIYTTIGDMGKDSKANGFTYAPPAGDDPITLPKARQPADTPGGKAISVFTTPPPPEQIIQQQAESSAMKDIKKTPMIVFEDVVCVPDSYNIDIFLAGTRATVADPTNNPDFVGRVFRFGMGRPRDGAEVRNGFRCNKPAVTRVLDASKVADKIADYGFVQVVTRVGDDAPLPEAEWKNMRGFTGKLVWLFDASHEEFGQRTSVSETQSCCSLR